MQIPDSKSSGILKQFIFFIHFIRYRQHRHYYGSIGTK
ncbi:hypothetical protein SALWKB2_1310 [Snodgrassella alvi wkB2]|nr:hypothetical protein SALWKB2_1310 [Snodgrassella alvi wkB2]